MHPTDEQAAAIQGFKTGQNLVLEAGAGTGKTSTLRTMGQSTKGHGVYIAFNRAIADDAKKSFPANVECATAHSFAYRAVGHQYRGRLNGPRVTAKTIAEVLRAPGFRRGELALGPRKVARLAMDTVERFCRSAHKEIGRRHVPFVEGLDEAAQDQLGELVTPLARMAWDDLTQQRGRLKFDHSHYLKMWALTEPNLNADFVLFDEAQDANPLMASVVERQPCQKVLVGDRSQAIYEWNGAVDAMSKFDGSRFILSQSFRFGQGIADEANKWLDLLDAPLRLSGSKALQSTIRPLGSPDAVLCRTNAEAVSQAIQAQAARQSYALVGGTREIKSFASGASDLMRGRDAWHPDLAAFSSWEQVQEYVEDDGGGADLRTFVRLIDRYGPQEVIRIAESAVPEEHATVVLSTAHKAKGREWDTVKIAEDFQEPGEDSTLTKADARLAYVAVTRAKRALDNAGLAWVAGWAGRQAA